MKGLRLAGITADGRMVYLPMEMLRCRLRGHSWYAMEGHPSSTRMCVRCGTMDPCPYEIVEATEDG